MASWGLLILLKETCGIFYKSQGSFQNILSKDKQELFTNKMNNFKKKANANSFLWFLTSRSPQESHLTKSNSECARFCEIIFENKWQHSSDAVK